MTSYTITKKKKFDSSGILIMISFILLLSCLIVPLVAIYTYQDIFINDVESWFFGTPKNNYFIFAGALISFSVLIICFLIYQNKMQMSERKVRNLPFILLLLPGIITILLSLHHYYYLNEDGVHYSSFSKFNVQSYKWEEVVEAKQLQKVNNGVMIEGDLVFIFKNGDEFHLPVTKEVQVNKRRIYTALREFNIEVKRILPEAQ
jgi:uncharacterized membrane protein